MEEVVSLEKLLARISDNSIYKLAVLAAKRAIILADGEKPLVDKPSGKALDNSLREIQEGKIRIKQS